jgi:hypothetical protein
MEDRLARQGYRLLAELGYLKLQGVGYPRNGARIVVSDETASILEDAGFDQPGLLSETTIEQLLRIPGFGPRRFVDLMVGVEAWGMRSDKRAMQRLDIESTARRCLGLLGKVDLQRAAMDVRIGECLRVLPKASSSFGSPASALDRTANHAEAIPPRYLPRCREALGALLSRIEHCNSCTLQEELLEVAVAATKRGKGVDAVVMRLGLDGRPPMTLEAAGERLGVTRERIRQIVGKARETVTGRVIVTPALDKAVSIIAESVPLSETACNDAWLREGVVGEDFSLISLIAAADFIGRELDFAVDESGGEPFAVPIDWLGQGGNRGIAKGVRHEAICVFQLKSHTIPVEIAQRSARSRTAFRRKSHAVPL